MVESATVIFNLMTVVPEIYVRYVLIPIADCQIIGIRLLAAEFRDPKVLQNGTTHVYSH
jgi:hypothetical protein